MKIYSDQQGYALDSWDRAGRLLSAVRHEIDQGKFDPRNYAKKEFNSLLFDNYALAWMQRREREYEHNLIAKSYLKSIREYVRNYYVPFFKEISLRDIREAHLEDFRNWLPGNLSIKTIYNILGVLHKLFRDAFRRKDILAMPEFSKVELVESVTEWISEEDQEKILAEVREPVYRAFYVFLMKQGCRPSEARAMKWEDIDLKKDTVVIRAAFDMDVYRPFTKEKDVRVLPLHPMVRETLLKLPRNLSGFVFINRYGRCLGRHRSYENWREAARRAGIKISCYEGTRHSLASQAVNRGVSQRLLKEFLGHKSEKSTSRYAKIVVGSLRKVWGEEDCTASLICPRKDKKQK